MKESEPQFKVTRDERERVTHITFELPDSAMLNRSTNQLMEEIIFMAAEQWLKTHGAELLNAIAPDAVAEVVKKRIADKVIKGLTRETDR